jgi:hypothetical protein
MSFVVHSQEIMCGFLDYVSKARFGSGSGFGASPNLNRTYQNLNQTNGSVSGSAKNGKELD